ncbi:MAG: hypothetical protein KJ571_09025 [Bacteroidetes bacterium]|nr:hypothetical protein [Bacteroidota bacterium]
MNTQTLEETKKKILSIVEELEPVELNSLKHYAEYLAHRSNDLNFLEVLRNAQPEDEDLDKSEIEGMKTAKKEFKKGNFLELNDYMKKRKLL